MKTAITITLIVIAVLFTLGGITHESPTRGRNAAIVAAVATVALAAIAIGKNGQLLKLV